MTTMKRYRAYLPVFAISIALAVFLAFPAQADQTIEVGYRGCEFADAVRAANTNLPFGNCKAGDPGHDHIYVHGAVPLLEPPVLITEDLSIVGDRYTSTLDGQGRHSFFHVGPGIDLHLQDLFMSNGYGTRESGQARVESGGRIYFSTARVINCRGVKEIVAAEDTFVHIGHAASICGKAPPFNPHPPVRPLPGPQDKEPSRPRGKPAREPEPVATPVAVHTCEHLPKNIIVRANAGLRSGIQCQPIDESGVGQQSVIDQGIIAAVDIWGYVEPGVEVCFHGVGSLMFLDAAFAPRRVLSVDPYQYSGMTCASFNRAGSLVLVGADSPHPLHQGEQTYCTVSTTAMLNFRDAPAGSTIYGLVPPGAVVNVEARTGDWYRIVFNGLVGWISADFATPVQQCA